MSSWEDEFRNRRKKECFCGDLTRDIRDEDLRNKEFNQCIIDPLGFVENRYKDELCTFGRTDDPKIRDLLKCEKTEKVINLMAKEKEGPESSYQINYEEGIKRALEDLEKFKGKEIEPLKPKEQKMTQEKNEKEHFKLVESCLPTESHVIEYRRVEPPGSDPSAVEGNFVIRFFRSLLSSRKPHKISQTKLRPPTVAVTHQVKHEDKKFAHKEHLEKEWDRTFFEILEKEKRIQKREKNNDH